MQLPSVTTINPEHESLNVQLGLPEPFNTPELENWIQRPFPTPNIPTHIRADYSSAWSELERITNAFDGQEMKFDEDAESWEQVDSELRSRYTINQITVEDLPPFYKPLTNTGQSSSIKIYYAIRKDNQDSSYVFDTKQSLENGQVFRSIAFVDSKRSQIQTDFQDGLNEKAEIQKLYVQAGSEIVEIVDNANGQSSINPNNLNGRLFVSTQKVTQFNGKNEQSAYKSGQGFYMADENNIYIDGFGPNQIITLTHEIGHFIQHQRLTTNACWTVIEARHPKASPSSSTEAETIKTFADAREMGIMKTSLVNQAESSASTIGKKIIIRYFPSLETYDEKDTQSALNSYEIAGNLSFRNSVTTISRSLGLQEHLARLAPNNFAFGMHQLVRDEPLLSRLLGDRKIFTLPANKYTRIKVAGIMRGKNPEFHLIQEGSSNYFHRISIFRNAIFYLHQENGQSRVTNFSWPNNNIENPTFDEITDPAAYILGFEAVSDKILADYLKSLKEIKQYYDNMLISIRPYLPEDILEFIKNYPSNIQGESYSDLDHFWNYACIHLRGTKFEYILEKTDIVNQDDWQRLVKAGYEILYEEQKPGWKLGENVDELKQLARERACVIRFANYLESARKRGNTHL